MTIDTKYKNDLYVAEQLIAHDECMTQQFFYKDCRPLFVSIIHSIFQGRVEYDELISELYLHLMENEAQRLKQYQGRSSIYQWLKIVAIRFFIEKREQLIENDSFEPLFEQVMDEQIEEPTQQWAAAMDIQHLFDLMPNKRYVYVIRRIMLDEACPQDVAMELGLTVENVYNIKNRAMAALTAIALKERRSYDR